MIDIFEALDWLNVNDEDTCLTNVERGLSMGARVISHSDADVRRIIDRLRELAQNSGDRRERAEVALHIAAVEYARGWFAQAAQDARAAVRVYQTDDRRRAVARWILGMAEWRLSQNSRAYTNWRSARKIFRDCQSHFSNSPNMNNWYQDWIWQMDLELVAKPEEMHTWLNRFGGTGLTASSRQLADSITENIRQRRYPDAYAIIRDIQQVTRWSTEIYERVEVFLECGLAAYQMGNLDSAIQLLKNAVTDFAPGLGKNHKRTVARCMLGAIEWLDPASHNQAIVDWRKCLEEFRELRLQADRDNEQSKKKWYADHIVLLQSALSERLPGSQPQGRKPRRPEPTRPATTPPPGSNHPHEPGPQRSTSRPDPGQESRYEYLCILVGGDPIIADGLIDYERQKVPNASRAELIERAIERLLRDRK